MYNILFEIMRLNYDTHILVGIRTFINLFLIFTKIEQVKLHKTIFLKILCIKNGTQKT